MHRATNHFWIGALSACVLAAGQSAWAVAPKQDDAKPVAVAMTRKAKDSVQYKDMITLSLNGTDVALEQNRKHTVKEIKDDGPTTIIVTDLGGKVTFNGSDMDTPPGSPVTVTQTPTGKILSYKPDMEDNPYLSTTTLHLIALADQIVFPDKPVKPGDSWTTEIDNPQVKGKKVTIKTTYVGADKVDTMATWKVKQTMEADTDSGKMTAEITAMLDPANGQIVQAEHMAKGVPGTMGAFDWKGKIQRAKADAEKKAAAL